MGRARRVAVRCGRLRLADRMLMARTRHDHLSKDLLVEWCARLGSAHAGRAVRGEERTIDVFVEVRPGKEKWRAVLGLLARMAEGDTGIEAHRNAMTWDEIVGCAVKGAELRAERLRKARRSRKTRGDVGAVTMWALTPTLSAELRELFKLEALVGWPPGFVDLPGFRMGIVVLHELTETPESLWLRLLARDDVQERAFAELDALPRTHPLRTRSITRVLRYVAEAKQAPRPTREQQEIVMNAQRLVEKWERDAITRGKLEGLAEGEAKGLAEGEARGEAKGRAEAILAFLEAREVKVSAADRRRVLGCSDPALLDEWTRRAAVVSSARQLFASS